MACSEKLVTELKKELQDIVDQCTSLLESAPDPKMDYGVTKKYWIENARDTLDSIKL